MLTREDDVDACALHRQGWTISAIARHLGHDRKTIRAYVTGRRTAGARVRAAGDNFGPFVDYAAARLGEDPHLWASALFDELLGLGFTGSYPTLTRQIRGRRLRPACEPCSPAKGRPVAVIEHPAGAETQWDWLELPDPPAAWGWGSQACRPSSNSLPGGGFRQVIPWWPVGLPFQASGPGMCRTQEDEPGRGRRARVLHRLE